MALYPARVGNLLSGMLSCNVCEIKTGYMLKYGWCEMDRSWWEMYKVLCMGNESGCCCEAGVNVLLILFRYSGEITSHYQ